MLVNEKQNTVMTNNSSQEHSFGMKPSAKSFKILSSSIYEHKIRAIIRELCCNASDSHISAGIPETPIRVFLPTLFEQIFVVEDFGIGLSHEDVIYIFTTYFESTKTESADETGALGLGSKSPFCYQTQMSVISRKDGVERSYSCYIGEDGEPKTRLRSENNTNEPNGVKITVPVNQNDIYEFEEEAKKVFSFFKVKPDCNKEVEPYLSQQELETLFDDDYLELEQRDALTRSSRVFAVMGNVAYPVNVNFEFCKSPILLNPENSAMYGEEEQYYEFDKADVHYTEFVVENTNKCIFVNFELGALDFAASRETLSFDSETKINFYSRLVEKCSRNRKVFQQELDTCDTKVDALLKYIKKYGNSKDKMSKSFTYNGVQIFNLHNETLFNFTSKVTHTREDGSQYDLITTDKDVRQFSLRRNRTNMRFNVDDRNMSKITFAHLINLDGVDVVNEKVKCIYIDDPKMKSGSIRMLKAYLKERLGNDEIFFFVNEKDGSKIQDDYGIFEFVPISQVKSEILQKDPNFFTSNRGGYRGSLGLDEYSFQGKIFRGTGVGVTKSGKVETSDYSREENVYVMGWDGTNTLMQKDHKGRMLFLNEHDVKFLMSCFGIKNIFLMNQRNQKKILKAGYMEFFDFIKENCEKIEDQIQKAHDHTNKVPEEDLLKTVTNKFSRSNIYYQEIFEKIINKDKKLVKLFDEFDEIRDSRIDGEVNFIRTARMNYLKRILGPEAWKKVKPKNDLVAVYNKINNRLRSILDNKYPLIRRVNMPANSDDAGVAINHLILYIDAVDSHTEQ